MALPNSVRKAIVTGLYSGYLPIAPGTWGSAAVCVIFLAVTAVSSANQFVVSGVMLLVAILSSVACVSLGDFTEQAFGKKDPGKCVIDEWAGQSIALIWLPLTCQPKSWLIAAAVGFVAFRIFDIIKPPPARQLEKLPKGWGVLLDDIAAGVYACIASQLVLRILVS